MPHPPAAAKHDHIDWIFDEFILRYRDPRRFGAVLWHPREAGDVLEHPLLASLGVEPFSPAFSGALMHRLTRGRKVSVKQALLAGEIVVGVGNIYASESLFRAGIRPTTAAGRVSLVRYELLADAVRVDARRRDREGRQHVARFRRQQRRKRLLPARLFRL